MQDQYLFALRSARQRQVHVLDEPAGKEILRSAGIRVPRSALVAADGDVAGAASMLRPPLVLKVVAEGVVHKSDVGGVRLNLHDSVAAAAAAREVQQSLRAQGVEPKEWLIEEMAPSGTEVVVGGVMDREFGPMVMVGVGGVFVEVIEDVAFRICPIVQRDAREMLQELKGSALLHGARGQEPANIDAIVDVLLRVGGDGGLLMVGADEIAEMDINPLIVSRDAAVAVDARFILQPRA